MLEFNASGMNATIKGHLLYLSERRSVALIHDIHSAGLLCGHGARVERDQ
jgi:hypothetical protein